MTLIAKIGGVDSYLPAHLLNVSSTGADVRMTMILTESYESAIEAHPRFSNNERHHHLRGGVSMTQYVSPGTSLTLNDWGTDIYKRDTSSDILVTVVEGAIEGVAELF